MGFIRKISRVVRVWVAVLIAGVASLVGVPHVAANAANPVVAENERRGGDGWQLRNEANDVDLQIKGYASATSVNIGDRIDFHVSVSRPQPFSIEIYRMGWYGADVADGAQGRLHITMGPYDGTSQAGPIKNSLTGLVTVDWSRSASLTVPSSWVSGNYLAKLVRQDGFDNHIPFVVRDDARSADVLVQLPYTTYQAYNNFPHGTVGTSLYDHNSSDGQRAEQVTFDRPYARSGAGQFFDFDYPTIRWLEMQGYDAVYTTNIDTHTNGARLTDYRAFVSVGHDEYWTSAMYDAADAARDQGDTDLVFFGANSVYWRIELLASETTGVGHRVIASQRRHRIDRWRDQGRPEQQLLGVQYLRPFSEDHRQMVVDNASSELWRGTGVENQTRLGPAQNVHRKNLVGYEVDGVDPDHPGPITTNQIFLTASPFHCLDQAQPSCPDSEKNIQRTSLYEAPSGSWVFATGTLGWSYGLGHPDYPSLENTAIQQLTINVFDKMLPAMMRDATNMDQLVRSPDYDPLTDGDVLRLYRAFFDREPDVNGAQYWLDVREEFSLTQIADFFTGSREYANNYNGTNDRQFLTSVYRNVLGRDYDQDGFDYWLEILRTGTTRGEVVRWIAASDEFRNQYPYRG